MAFPYTKHPGYGSLGLQNKQKEKKMGDNKDVAASKVFVYGGQYVEDIAYSTYIKRSPCQTKELDQRNTQIFGVRILEILACARFREQAQTPSGRFFLCLNLF
jgi:hypothetical protein